MMARLNFLRIITLLAACSDAVFAAETDKKTEWDCTPTATQFIGEAWRSEMINGTYPSGPDVLLASKQGLDPVIFTSGSPNPRQIRKFEASEIKIRWGKDGYYYLDEMRNRRSPEEWGKIEGHLCAESAFSLECRDKDGGWPQFILLFNKKLGLYSFHSIGGYVGRVSAEGQLLDREWMSVGSCKARDSEG
jgi:hypothetical protein